MTRRQRRELLKYRLANRTVTGADGLQHAPRNCGCPACTRTQTMNEVQPAIERGECWACGECVPWLCRCGEQNCNWFADKCEQCGAVKPSPRDHPGPHVRARLLRELDDLRAQLDAQL